MTPPGERRRCTGGPGPSHRSLTNWDNGFVPEFFCRLRVRCECGTAVLCANLRTGFSWHVWEMVMTARKTFLGLRENCGTRTAVGTAPGTPTFHGCLSM